MIYFDHAATSLHKPPQVAKAVYHALLGTGNSGRGVHGASLEASRLIYQTREKISQLFNVGDPSRVVFTSNATESLNIAIQGLLGPGDHCITTSLEHNSVLRPLYLMKNKGVDFTIIPADQKGYIDVLKIAGAISSKTKMVILTHGSNVLGNVTEIQAIGEMCKRHKLLLILDASQTAGLIPIDMKAAGISALCCSGHKSLLGPQGIGMLCLAKGVLPSPLKVGGTGVDSFSHHMGSLLPTALEAGTLNAHAIAGLSAACDYLNEYGQVRILKEATDLAKRFIRNIKDLPGITLYGDLEAEIRTPVVSLNIGEMDSSEVADELFYRFGIATRAGAHCAPEVHKTLETVEQGMVRFSFSHFNTIEEVDQAVVALKILEEENR